MCLASNTFFYIEVSCLLLKKKRKKLAVLAKKDVSVWTSMFPSKEMTQWWNLYIKHRPVEEKLIIRQSHESIFLMGNFIPYIIIEAAKLTYSQEKKGTS